MSDRRPKRRCVSSKAQAMASAIHYVGYVEDNETPEMIMKKFEELERIQKAAGARRQQQQQQQQGPACHQPDPSGAACPSTGPSFGPPAGDAAQAPPSSSAAVAGTAPQQQPSAGLPDPQAASAAAQTDDQMLLDEEALMEVFRQTSILGGAAGAAAAAMSRLYGGDIAYGMEDMLFVGGDELGVTPSDVEEEELRQMREGGGFWSDEDFELGGRSRDSRRRRAQGAAAGGGGGSRSGGGGGQRGAGQDSDSAPGREGKQSSRAPGPSGQSRHAMNQVVMQYNRDTNALIRRRVASGGSGGGGAAAAGGGAAGGLVQLRVPPPPLPLSWGRTVRPYQPSEPYQPPDDPTKQPSAVAAGTAEATGTAAAAASTSSRAFEAADVSAFPYDTALGGKQYIAVVVNAGWQPPAASDSFEGGAEAEVMRRFRALPLPRLVPRGFVMVWAHKGLLQAVCRCLAGWGYAYVENLTWVHLTPGNAIATQPGAHFRRSHSTLLIFRREGEGRDIELRHQRNPDVVFDCIRTLPDGSGWDVPPEVLTTIETMLPSGKGAFLELWAPRGQRRPGWDHVAEIQ